MCHILALLIEYQHRYMKKNYLNPQGNSKVKLKQYLFSNYYVSRRILGCEDIILSQTQSFVNFTAKQYRKIKIKMTNNKINKDNAMGQINSILI